MSNLRDFAPPLSNSKIIPFAVEMKHLGVILLDSRPSWSMYGTVNWGLGLTPNSCQNGLPSFRRLNKLSLF